MVPCIRQSNGIIDTAVLDLEEAHAALGVSTAETVERHEHGVEGAHSMQLHALQAHFQYLRKLCSSGGAKVASQVFAPGRVVVLAELEVPASGEVKARGPGTSSQEPDLDTITCYHVPGVVLEVLVSVLSQNNCVSQVHWPSPCIATTSGWYC